MKTVIIIPARYSSVRFPGKPLVKLSVGRGLQKSLIQLSWEAACKVRDVEHIFVATDDERIRAQAGSLVLDGSSDLNGVYVLCKGMFVMLSPKKCSIISARKNLLSV